MSGKPFIALILVAAACTHPAPTPPAPAVPSPAPGPQRAAPVVPPTQPAEPAPPLPSIPLVEGPLAIHVVYPSENASLANRDSNYMLGSVGNGHASLTINGHPATVYPNGAFMAFVPQPGPTSPRFDLVAALGSDTARLTHTLRAPSERVALPLEGRIIVD